MPFTNEQKNLIVDIDQRVNLIYSKGGDEALLLNLADLMSTTGLRALISSPYKEELNHCCQQYSGFMQLMKLLESLANGIKNGTISVPE